jgi:hypothetical protein
MNNIGMHRQMNMSDEESKRHKSNVLSHAAVFNVLCDKTPMSYSEVETDA